MSESASWPAWTKTGSYTLKRVLYRELSFPPPSKFPLSLAVLIPDLYRAGRIPSPDELVFFDLETTGLSGGAGTIAFLAAFGRFTVSANSPSLKSAGLEITQYLLLDYPGESDFLESVAAEFQSASSAVPFMVSFNGKTFDSQILKTRCLMNGMLAPQYLHADLLHPSRRLWKRLLPDCSQATIEENILDLDRSGDMPGALAPEIWFSFLRSGETGELLAICDHNAKDITGLASIFLAMVEIASEPFENRNALRFDEEALAITWNQSVKRGAAFFGEGEKETGRLLLERAAANGFPAAAFNLAVWLFKNGRHHEARAFMAKVVNSADGAASPNLRAAAFESLAVDAEWRLRDPVLALDFTNSALALEEVPDAFRKRFEKRQARLEEKRKHKQGCST